MNVTASDLAMEREQRRIDDIRAGDPPEGELVAKHALADSLRKALSRQGLATWGGRGSVEDVAADLHAQGWRLKS